MVVGAFQFLRISQMRKHSTGAKISIKVSFEPVTTVENACSPVF
jgi:hypothetical protein